MSGQTQLKSKSISQAMLLFCISIGLLFCAGMPLQAISVTVGLLFTLVVCVLLPAIVFVWVKKLPILKALRFNKVGVSVIFSSILIGVGGWSLAYGLHLGLVTLIGPPIGGAGLSMTTTSEYVGLILVGALLPGICEEVLFRGAIQGVLERRGKWFGVLVAAILFGLFHLDPWRIIPATLLGVIFGWLVMKTNSILPAIVAHASNNAIAISVGFFVADESQLNTVVLPILFSILVLGLFLFLWVIRKSENCPDNILNSVSAALPTPLVWLTGLLMTAFVGLLAAFAWLMIFIVTTSTMHDAALDPHIKEGDQLILMRAGSVASDIEGGDTISFKKGDETWTRVVVEVESDHVSVLHEEEWMKVPMEDVIGEMIQIIPTGSPE